MHTLLAVVVGFVVASAGAMTDRYYPDRDVKSPSGKWRLTAVSPYNAGEKPRPFARDFTYTLYDTVSGEAVWQRKQPENEGSPTDVFVHDEGWVVVRVWSDGIMVLGPAKGEKTLQISLFDSFPEAEKKEHIAHTTAGPMWSSGSHWYFHSFEKQTYFIVRTGWGRRVIVNLDASSLVRAPREALLESAVAAEKRFVVETLAHAGANLDAIGAAEGDAHGIAAWDVMSAINMAVALEVDEAMPSLRKLEKSAYIGSSGGWFDFDQRFVQNAINPFMSAEFTIRRAAQYAQRRFGATPALLPATGFWRTGPGREWVEIKPMEKPRAQCIALVQPGMSVEALLGAIGAPDYVSTTHRAWEYDIDSAAPYTLRVFFDESHNAVKDWKMVKPPLWDSGERQAQLFGNGW